MHKQDARPQRRGQGAQDGRTPGRGGPKQRGGHGAPHGPARPQDPPVRMTFEGGEVRLQRVAPHRPGTKTEVAATPVPTPPAPVTPARPGAPLRAERELPLPRALRHLEAERAPAAPHAPRKSVPAPAPRTHIAPSGPTAPSTGPWTRWLGGRTPTPVQRESIPALIAGRDLITIAKTGSGKTLAFLIPVAEAGLGRGARHEGRTQMCPEVLVVAPTRELAVQIRDVARELGLAAGRITGGISPAETRAEARGQGVITGTPGRLLDLLRKGELRLSRLKYVVLDEADELLSLGFLKDVAEILAAGEAQSGAHPQTVLASATFPAEVRAVAERFMVRPARVEVAPESQGPQTGAGQAVHLLRDTSRAALVGEMARECRHHLSQPGGCVVVFCRTKALTRLRREQLQALLPSEQVVALEGNMDQRQRERVMGELRAGQARVLVATDIAGRGIDLPEVRLVIHGDVAMGSEDHVHRSGRTARAGRGGTNLVLLIPEQRALWQSVRRGLPGHLQPPASREEAQIDRRIQEKTGKGSGNGVDPPQPAGRPGGRSARPPHAGRDRRRSA